MSSRHMIRLDGWLAALVIAALLALMMPWLVSYAKKASGLSTGHPRTTVGPHIAAKTSWGT